MLTSLNKGFLLTNTVSFYPDMLYIQISSSLWSFASKGQQLLFFYEYLNWKHQNILKGESLAIIRYMTPWHSNDLSIIQNQFKRCTSFLSVVQKATQKNCVQTLGKHLKNIGFFARKPFVFFSDFLYFYQ